MSTVNQPLSFLFLAVFADGSRIEQTQEDISVVDPKRSAFFDVMERAKTIPLLGFGIENVQTGDTYGVDLVDGTFEVNKLPLHLHDQKFAPSMHDLKLIFFRETRVDAVMNAQSEITQQRHYINRYIIGWETNVDGKNVKETLAVPS